jgi:hypothetical protein
VPSSSSSSSNRNSSSPNQPSTTSLTSQSQPTNHPSRATNHLKLVNQVNQPTNHPTHTTTPNPQILKPPPTTTLIQPHLLQTHPPNIRLRRTSRQPRRLTGIRIRPGYTLLAHRRRRLPPRGRWPALCHLAHQPLRRLLWCRYGPEELWAGDGAPDRALAGVDHEREGQAGDDDSEDGEHHCRYCALRGVRGCGDKR